jgi:DNA repair protein REV1
LIPKTLTFSSFQSATCNYIARTYGIKKGMFLGRAKELCPTLVALRYDFDGYEEVTETVTEILWQHANEYGGVVEQVSCDEAYMEVYFSGDVGNVQSQLATNAMQELAETIRCQVFDATQCTCTVGVGANKLLAKLATDKVKPDKTHVVTDFRDLLAPLKLGDLHGIGYRLGEKLTKEGFESIQDIWNLGNEGESVLRRILGDVTGAKIWDACNGRDARPVKEAQRKSIGAEVSDT